MMWLMVMVMVMVVGLAPSTHGGGALTIEVSSLGAPTDHRGCLLMVMVMVMVTMMMKIMVIV